MAAPYRLVLTRHGESEWNLHNRFTGWTDVGLTAKGRQQARRAGNILAARGYVFDTVHTSLLARAIETGDLLLARMGLGWLPVVKHWRLNERHYGALQGLNKAETAEKRGAEQVHIWRRSYAVLPPPLEQGDPRHPCNDSRYSLLDPLVLPGVESLATCLARVLPYWHDAIAPAIRGGQRVLVAAHGNSLRALVKYLDDVPDADITGLEIPVGVPLVYELGHDLRPLRNYYLGEAVEVAPGRCVALAGSAAALLGPLAQVMTSAGVCSAEQLVLLVPAAGGGPGGDGLQAVAAGLPAGVRQEPDVVDAVRDTGLIFAGLDRPTSSPQAVQLLKQLGASLSGPSGGRLLVLLAREPQEPEPGPATGQGQGQASGQASQQASRGEAGLLQLAEAAGLQQQPGARVLGLLLQPGGGASVVGPGGSSGVKGQSAWPGVAAAVLLQLGCASDHDVQMVRSMVEAADGLPVVVRGAAATAVAEAPAGPLV